MTRLYLFESDSFDPYYNLACEEDLLDRLDMDSTILMFYVNDRSLIIGKHQNPWREISLESSRRLNVPVVRRISGGGAVFHDRGNLVFSFMCRRERMSRAGNLEIVREALASLDIAAEMTEMFDLYLDGKKISGNAFCYRKGVALHHGTILVDTDGEAMRGLLRRNESSISTHAVKSRPAKTTNIRVSSPGVTIEEIRHAIVRTATRRIDGGTIRRIDANDLSEKRIANLESKNRSWEWTFGRTPRFEVTMRCTGGEPFTMKVHRGEVEAVESDTPGLTDLVGCRFERCDISVRSSDLPDAARKTVECAMAESGIL